MVVISARKFSRDVIRVFMIKFRVQAAAANEVERGEDKQKTEFHDPKKL